MASRDYRHRETLPPIRDVLGDQLDRRLPPYGGAYDGAYPVPSVPRAHPSITSQHRSGGTWPSPAHAPRNYQQAPLHQNSVYDSRHPPSQPTTATRMHTSTSSPATPSGHHPFNVLRLTPAGLIHAASSDRSQGILRTTRADAGRRQVPPHAQHENGDEQDDMEKRYACPICDKRFPRPSSLKAHEVVHNDKRPYECPHPSCDKNFTVASNMRRHYRKAHEGGGSGEDDVDDYHYTSSRSAQGSSAHYYSRR